jgi:RHS repeat-associated protein
LEIFNKFTCHDFNWIDNQLTGWAGATPSYDGRGNLVCDNYSAAASSCTGRSYTWDARSRLTALQGGGKFYYDAIGRRRSFNNTAQASYLYDGGNIVQQFSAGASVATLLNGLSLDERFTSTGSTSTSTFLTDAQGSTVALTDPTGATVTTSYAYDPYGNVTASGTASTNAFQFTGRENDGNGLYFYRGRYYNPNWGRFISEDPAGFGGGDDNLYRYVAGDPVNNVDPTGLSFTSQTGSNLPSAPASETGNSCSSNPPLPLQVAGVCQGPLCTLGSPDASESLIRNYPE